MNVRIASPLYGGQCSGYFLTSMLELTNELKQTEIAYSTQFMFNESLITRARNKLANDMLKDPSITHLLFIDSDMKFYSEDIILMLNTGLDILCGICPKKKINWEGVRDAVKNNESNLAKKSGEFAINVEIPSEGMQVRKYEPVEITRGGTGIMLIKREVFEQLIPHVESYQDIDGSTVYDFFKTEIKNNVYLSEDYYFCELWRKHGGKIYGAPWADIGHHGSYLFEGSIF